MALNTAALANQYSHQANKHEQHKPQQPGARVGIHKHFTKVLILFKALRLNTIHSPTREAKAE